MNLKKHYQLPTQFFDACILLGYDALQLIGRGVYVADADGGYIVNSALMV